MQTPSSPQSLWKGIYKKKEKQSQKFGIGLNKQIVEEHIIVLFHLYKVQNLVKQSYFRNIYMFSNIRKKNIDDCKIQDGGVPWGCRIKVDMIEYGVIQRISEVLVQFCFFFLMGCEHKVFPLLLFISLLSIYWAPMAGQALLTVLEIEQGTRKTKIPIFMELICWWTFHK